MPIDDLARNDVVTAAPATPVPDLAATMDEQGVGSIVITEGAEPVGIVTDRDLTVRVLPDASDPAAWTAQDVMTPDPVVVPRGAGFYRATEAMAESGVRRLPVTEGGEVEGIITADDITELIADEEQQLAAVIRAQRPEY